MHILAQNAATGFEWSTVITAAVVAGLVVPLSQWLLKTYGLSAKLHPMFHGRFGRISTTADFSDRATAINSVTGAPVPEHANRIPAKMTGWDRAGNQSQFRA